MKLHHRLLAGIIALTALLPAAPSDSTVTAPVSPFFIQGVWKGYQTLVKDSVAFAFYSKNRGRTFTKGQIVSSFNYTVNYGATPITLDMVQKQGRNRAIIKFIGRDTLFIKMSNDTAFPAAFISGFDSSACLLIREPMPGQDSALGK